MRGINQERLEEIRKLLSVISKGHWCFIVGENDEGLLIATKSTERHLIYKEMDEWNVLAKFQGKALTSDVNFLGNAKQYVTELLDEVDRLQALATSLHQG